MSDMEEPLFPSVTTKQPETPEKPITKKERRSVLKKVLSEQMSLEEIEGNLFDPDKNHFIFKEQETQRIMVKSVIDNHNYQENEERKKSDEVKFIDFKIHEVENWKKHNKPVRCCGCLFKFWS